MEPSEERLFRLYRSRRTVLQILQDRGYADAEGEHQTFEEFCDWVDDLEDSDTDTEELSEKEIKESMVMTFSKAGKDEIRVYWYTEAKLGTEFRNIVGELKEEDISRAIIVIEVSVTPHAKNTLKGLRSQKMYIDVFRVEETQINISHNRLVPKHVVCSRGEKMKVMKAYQVDRTQLPYIKTIDPMVKYLGAVKGQLIKIIRNSETMKGEKVISYRLVV